MSAASQRDPIDVLAEVVQDHEKRIRRVERVLWAVAGAAGSSGVWMTIVMTRR